MIFVGIDVAKDTHYAAVSDDSGAVLVKPFAFQNNAEGFCLLLKKLSEFDRSKLLIGLESTGIYSENLICFLYESGFRLAVINPIQTATLRKTAIRKTKTDKVDTMLIIKSLMVNSYRLYSQRDADSLKLRTLCRFRQNLKKSKARLKIQLAGYVNLVFPEFGKFFKSGIHIAASYALLKKYSSPKEIAALRTSTLCTLLSKASHGRFGKDTAEALKSLALSSVGVKNPYISIQIAQTIAQIELLEQQIKDLNSAIEEAMESINSVLMTVPGIGAVNAACILGEIGDIHRFSSSNKLLAYAGLDPSVYQSGNFQAKKTRMSKRGSKVLRYALVNAAHNVVKNNATFKAYYEAKMAEGRTHYNALGHCAGKLVRIIWKMMTDNVEFNLD